MCGVLALIAPFGSSPGLDRAGIERLRDRMTHRGPDDAGLLDRGNVVLAHRRLAVIDPGPGGHQPMTTPDGRFAIVYNGELYNDAEVRAELEAQGARFRTTSDTETVLAAVARWGAEAFPRLRGMFALVVHDSAEHRVLLARDPLGIKPLYFWKTSSGGTAQLVVASEIQAIVAHPGLSPRPDLAAVSAYLTTIRTTIGDRTLFEGVRALEPGQVLEVDLRSSGLTARVTTIPIEGDAAAASAEEVRQIVAESVRAHLRSDVPICALLSGGLDSTITTAVARGVVPELWTYCAGARMDGPPGGGVNDLEAAAEVAERFGTIHAEAIVTEALFAERWPEMVERTGLPLSTPNEVAIHEVARRLRADGKIVTISGEGADELFGGYDILLGHAADFELTRASGGGADATARARARFQADDAAWVPIAAKPAILSESALAAAESDEVLLSVYTREFADLASRSEVRVDPLRVHLAFQRRINLTGLLLRLDSASMLAGVEGRTPFADVRVARLAESLPMGQKFIPGRGVAGTKIALRAAFSDLVPEFVLSRPKASFPLPFQRWCAGLAGRLGGNGPETDLFSEACLETVRARPGDLWSLAWPVLNVTMWARRWWG